MPFFKKQGLGSIWRRNGSFRHNPLLFMRISFTLPLHPVAPGIEGAFYRF